MIVVMDGSQGKVVGLRVTGTLHATDYETLLPMLEERFTEHGKLRVLFHADPGFQGWDLKAAWDDTAFGFAHVADFERLALVGAPDWVVWCVKLSAFLFKGEVRVFPADDLDAAWDWVRA